MFFEIGDTNLFSLLQKDKKGISHAKSILLTQLSRSTDKKRREQLVRNFSDYVIGVGEQRCRKIDPFNFITLFKTNFKLICKIFVYGMLLLLFFLLAYDLFCSFWDSLTYILFM
ncbi:hypothetical protein THOM_2413 [Trachipleistophora hominis]|uniref:Uncharacterized protein n=1 Tax=Trachipleistophora hominis TaxID=72359 RepID=L7JVA5_TRAHO|nr:hypothetical protein THOM_2413 [Trachipleistophora hominis]